ANNVEVFISPFLEVWRKTLSAVSSSEASYIVTCTILFFRSPPPPISCSGRDKWICWLLFCGLGEICFLILVFLLDHLFVGHFSTEKQRRAFGS
ncbi:hypothetical protein M406DRAFT_103065, partial [Cryphonectria parasitica EP155]